MPTIAPTHPMPVSVHVLRYASRVLVRGGLVCGALLVVGWFLATAVAAGVFGLAGTARTGLGRLLENWTLIAALGGFGTLLVSQFTLYFQHRGVRRVLDRIVVADPSGAGGPPVGWQHAAVQRKRAGAGLQVLGIPVIVVCGFFAAVGISVFNENPANWFALLLAVGGPLLVGLGIWMVRAGSRKVAGPARDRWGNRPSADDARPARPDRRALRALRPQVRALALLDRLRDRALQAVGALVALVAVLAGVGWFEAGIWLVTATTLLLAVAATLDAVLSRRRRRTLLREAADPAAPEPPAFLMRDVLREEVPGQSGLGSLLALAAGMLLVGAAGVRTGPEYPLGDFYQLFQLMATAGGVGLLFHASGWFAYRARTRDENDFLSRRWNSAG